MASHATDVEVVDFELGNDDLMDEEGAIEVNPSPLGPVPKLRSTITGGAASFAARDPSGGPKKTKGRGFMDEASDELNSRLAGRVFDSLDSNGGPGLQRSIEGWIVLVTGVHEEAQEDDLHNAFREFGQVKNLHMNLDRRTGFLKGYALIEYENQDEAHAAIDALNGTKLLTQTIYADWAFNNDPFECRNVRRRSLRARRSRSPRRMY